MMPATIEYAKPADVRLNDSDREPRLHAFPDGSYVALCGRTRAQVIEDPPALSGKRCRTCVEAAGRKHFVGR